MRRLFALLLTLAMVMSLGITAFAETTSYTLSVDQSDTHTYWIYQIATGDISGGKLVNVKWGKNAAKGDVGAPARGLDELEKANTAATDGEKLKVIRQYVDFSSERFGAITCDSGCGVPSGYYLVEDKGVASKDAQGNTTYALPDGDSYSLFVVKVIGEAATITPKRAAPTLDKGIGDDVDDISNDYNNAAIGDRVYYVARGTLPSNLNDFNTYYYKLDDTMSKGLTYFNDLRITLVNDGVSQDISQYFGGGYYRDDDGITHITYACPDLLALNNVKDGDGNRVYTVNAQSVIVFKYSAQLNADANIGALGNDNTAQLVYSNNPNLSGEPDTTPPVPPENPPPEPPQTPPETPPTPPGEDKQPVVPQPVSDSPNGKTPESQTRTFVTALRLMKLDQDGNPLSGAGFTITGDTLNCVYSVQESFLPTATGAAYWKLKPAREGEGPRYTMTPPRLVNEITAFRGDRPTAVDNTVLVETTSDRKEDTGVIAVDGRYYIVADLDALRGTAPLYQLLTPNKDEYDLKDAFHAEPDAPEVTTAQYGRVITCTGDAMKDVEGTDNVDFAVMVDENGIAYFAGLSAGEYEITETTVPEGYDSVVDPIKVSISFEAPETIHGPCTWSVNTPSSVDGNGIIQTTVVNNRGVVLPTTGGIGTTVFYAVGAVLAIGAGVLLITRKRMGEA